MQAISADGAVVASTTTDVDGRFELQDLPVGYLSIEARLDVSSAEPDARSEITALQGITIPVGKTYRIGRDEATAAALEGVPADALVLGTMVPVPRGSFVYPIGGVAPNGTRRPIGRIPPVSRFLLGDAYVYYVDLQPGVRFEHDVRYVFVNARTGRVTRRRAFFPPLINHARLWGSEVDQFVYTGIDLDDFDPNVVPPGATATPTPEVVQLPVLDVPLITLAQTAASAGLPIIRTSDFHPSTALHNSGPDSIFVLIIKGGYGPTFEADAKPNG